jgi:hypothetical protein
MTKWVGHRFVFYDYQEVEKWKFSLHKFGRLNSSVVIIFFWVHCGIVHKSWLFKQIGFCQFRERKSVLSSDTQKLVLKMAVDRLRQEDHVFKASLGYIADTVYKEKI